MEDYLGTTRCPATAKEKPKREKGNDRSSDCKYNPSDTIAQLFAPSSPTHTPPSFKFFVRKEEWYNNI